MNVSAWRFWHDDTWRFLRLAQIALAVGIVMTLVGYAIGGNGWLNVLSVLVVTHLIVASLLLVRTFELRHQRGEGPRC
jgi:hypothetical protein